jgi:exoribonuclease R
MLEGILRTKNYLDFWIEGLGVEFTGAPTAGRALPGDRVSWDGERATLVSRAEYPLLVGMLELTSKVRYGMTSRGALLFRFSPYNEAYPPFFVGCSQKDLTQNMLARIQVSDWPADSSCPRGLLVQTLGPAGDLATEEEALLAHYGSARWKKGEVGPLPAPPPAVTTSPSTRIFHIDPPGCRDIDDAVGILVEADGTVVLSVYIADVASWLLTAPPEVRAKAAAAGQTLYRDGVAVRPMLPLELSEGALSLLPGELRRVWTMKTQWRGGVMIGQTSFRQDVIRVAESHTYDTAISAWFAPILTEICGGETDPHKWIERLMILYNREMASILRTAGSGVLRKHGAPDRERLERLALLGLPAERLAAAAGEYCNPTDIDVSHWGLGESYYCHGTSPIRRWADCLNQLVFMELFRGGQGESASSTQIESLNRRASDSKKYERDLAFLRALVGPGAQKEVDAIIVENGLLWIGSWGRLVWADTGNAAPGDAIRAKVFCDAGKRNWKRRLVIHCLPHPLQD